MTTEIINNLPKGVPVIRILPDGTIKYITQEEALTYRGQPHGVPPEIPNINDPELKQASPGDMWPGTSFIDRAWGAEYTEGTPYRGIDPNTGKLKDPEEFKGYVTEWDDMNENMKMDWVNLWKTRNPQYIKTDLMYRALRDNANGTQYYYINNIIASRPGGGHAAPDPKTSSKSDLDEYYLNWVPMAGGEQLWYTESNARPGLWNRAKYAWIIQLPNPPQWFKNLFNQVIDKAGENEYEIFALLILGVAGLIAVAHIV